MTTTTPRPLDEFQTALTLTEVSKILGLTARSVSRLIKDGQVDSIRIGNRVFITREALADYIDSRTTRATRRRPKRSPKS